MSSTSRAWAAAASVAVVEALKDQGICRWNHTLKSVQNHLKNNVRSFSQAKKLSSSSSTTVSNSIRQKENAKQSEESLRTVMYLSCWGPN
ncbi:wound-responsive family protein [Trifolium medium]|uniref:Wound-responsive family protein n=1 Tax=Trifolium medium TaxID=97028 RepID=A0A392LYU0_9FABA|nr:wound-responsive family protein [Trifolium medium]